MGCVLEFVSHVRHQCFRRLLQVDPIGMIEKKIQRLKISRENIQSPIHRLLGALPEFALDKAFGLVVLRRRGLGNILREHQRRRWRRHGLREIK